MKFTTLSLATLTVVAITARFTEPNEGQKVINLVLEDQKYLIDIAGEQHWVTDDQKWEIRKVGAN